MEHWEYKRIVPGSDTAVLFVHGIVGTPAHFAPLVPLVPEGWSVHNLMLAGHGAGVGEFGRATMDQWKKQVHRALEQLRQCHARVFIVAHSMGTLLAIREAVEDPRRLAGLFLQAVPTRPWLPIKTAWAALRLALGCPGKNKTAHAMAADTSVRLTWQLWRYLPWLRPFTQLLAEARRTCALVPHLRVPTLIFQSRRDELVSFGACKDLTNPCMRVTVLYGSGHFSYGAQDLAAMQKAFDRMLRGLAFDEKSATIDSEQ